MYYHFCVAAQTVKQGESEPMKTNTLSLTLVSLFIGSAFLHPAQAVVPPPDGGYPNFTTAEGTNALQNLTTGAGNTGIGWYSLFNASIAKYNTGIGAGTLALNTGDGNTATGTAALLLNSTGVANTANGAFALINNTIGFNNTALGNAALFSNSTGAANTAIGFGALYSNTKANSNTAVGVSALFSNTAGNANTAVGNVALASHQSGAGNNAVGVSALTADVNGFGNNAFGETALFLNISGFGNTAVGDSAGFNIDGNYNICLGAGVEGNSGDNNTIRIGDNLPGNPGAAACFIGGINGQIAASGIAVFIDTSGKLGTITSSRQFKEEIKPMDKVSEPLFALKPVTFRYKKEIDPAGISQFGLVAEEVEKVNPDLVVHDKEGKPYTVRYEAVNVMLLNEFLKEHRKVEALQANIAQQRKDFEAAFADLKEQIQKVSAQLELNRAAPQTVLNNQ